MNDLCFFIERKDSVSDIPSINLYKNIKGTSGVQRYANNGKSKRNKMTKDQTEDKQRHTRPYIQRIGICVLLLMVAVAFGHLPVSKAESTSLKDMPVGAQSAVLMEQSSGRILYEKDPHTKRRIASITKIMTAIIAIESGKMDKTVTVSNSILKSEGSAIYLKPGEKIKLSDLVYGLMLRSGNDAAIAIAEYVGGSVDGFAVLMNDKAKWIGMENTHFTNPHGLDDSDNHYSSAYDMAILTQYAMKNKMYRKIAGTKVHRAPNPDEVWDRVWKNKNKLLTEKYKYCTGGKTGFTKKARRTLVTTASKDNLDLIVVTIDDSTDWADHIALYEEGFKEYQLTEVVPKGKVKGIKHGFYKNRAYLTSPLEYPLTDKEMKEIKVTYKLQKPKKQWKKGKKLPDTIGKVHLMLNGKSVRSKPVYLKKEQETVLNLWKNQLKLFAGLETNG